ncbi:MAG: TonB-dependent siderophore receptor [Massilia sp.]|nr:TonB-dependent siderophore receptor [Massilia sp.]
MNHKRLRRMKSIYLTAGIVGSIIPAAHALAEEQAATTPAKQEQAKAAEAEALPLTKNVVSRESIDSASAGDGAEAIKNVAGVTSANAKTAENSSVNVRGIQLNLFTSYRLNGGLPTAGVITTPTEDKERVETLKGANALMFGIASPGGIINLVTKRATDKDITTLGLQGNAFGAYGAAIDIGRKFGDEKQFGLRVNFARAHISNGVEDADGVARFGSVAADWKATRSLSFKLDHERYSRNVIEQAGITPLKPVNGVIPVPRPPDPTQLLSGTWAHYTPSTRNTALRADYLLNDEWTLMGEIGRSDADRSRFSSRVGTYNLNTGAGTETITFLRGQLYQNKFARTELKGHLITAMLRHDLTLGVATSERFYNNPSTANAKVPQNIYDPVVIPPPVMPATPPTFLPQDSKDTGVYVYDAVGIGSDWKVLAGLRQTKYKADNLKTGGLHSITDSTTSSPALGLLYDLLPATTVYASYMKGLEETGQAPIGTVNEFQILPPAVATQKEVGIRSSYFSGVSANVALFDITRANSVTDEATNVFLLDGITRFQGVEATVNAELNKQFALGGGAQYLKAVQHPEFDQSVNGKTPENTPKLSGNMTLTYRVADIKGLTLRATTTYIGPRNIDAQNRGSIPGVSLFSAGAGYVTRIAGHRTALQVNVDNLTNKSYWNSATTSQLGAGMVRSVKFNAKIDF